MSSETPRTDAWIEAWERVNGYDFGRFDSHAADFMRELESPLAAVTAARDRYREALFNLSGELERYFDSGLFSTATDLYLLLEQARAALREGETK